jgi:2-oxoglutarate decarboxylase
MTTELEQRLVEIFGANTPFVKELFAEYEANPTAVKENWRTFFEELKSNKLNLLALESDPQRSPNFLQKSLFGNGHGNGQAEPGKPNGSTSEQAKAVSAQVAQRLTSSFLSLEAAGLTKEDTAILLTGAPLRIVENMEQSLSVPTATSFRTIPVKVLEENRVIINQHLSAISKGKLAFTHIIAWAIVQAIKKHPSLNCTYATVDGKSYKIAHKHINIGLAVDVTKKDGTRSLVVPNIKAADTMNFSQFFDAYNALVKKARENKLAPDDFIGTTVSLTNPGTIGTVASVPRLMMGQGIIIATGAIDYPAEYQAMSQTLLTQLGISKVMQITSTYDHRIIQGAESGELLAEIHKMLTAEDETFYDTIFSDLKAPYRPWRKQIDKNPLSLGGAPRTEELVEKQARVMQMINAYRVRGHLIANINPLGYEPKYHPELDPEFYGFTMWDYDREFLSMSFGKKDAMTLREIVRLLRSAYCEKIGVEFMHIQSIEQKRWIQQHIEDKERQVQFSPADKIEILKDITRAEGFERYLQTKFLGHKRFSVEGGETAIAIMDYLVLESAKYGTKEVVMGMAHRGRINVLTNVIGKPYEALFAEFEGKQLPMAEGDLAQGSGDVKYHLGATGIRTTKDGQTVRVSMSPNPSHLEAVNPVVEGIVRAKQDRAGDVEKKEILPILIHGDAAFAGQGVVAETLNMSQLRGYSTGGTIHLIINNQIGFTTTPEDARSTLYASDVAKMIQAPIFHVNGDDPEACIRVAKLALDYRMTFKNDVVIDMLCFRKYGHNEGDDPSYTQPLLYDKIKTHPGVREVYVRQLVREEVITQEEADTLNEAFKKELDLAHERAKKLVGKEQTQSLSKVDLMLAVENDQIAEKYRQRNPITKVDLQTLQTVAKASITFPDGFNVHPKLLQQFFSKREGALRADALNFQVDWAFAETLAFGSLLLEGYPVRLSGQDSTRGTFSQRHLGVVDVKTGAEYIMLQHIAPKFAPSQAPFYVYDSFLSEYAVMGFEFGYSVADPLALVMWEAQFGDFANGAQIIIDQFLSASESKWGQPSGLVLLLPHGYEGQGPEHSSARIERFLQLCAETNMQVCNCTTPAQYFHLLRRQVLAGNIKPLVIFTPKSLLRHPLAVSPMSELVEGKFHNVLDDVEDIKNPRRVILCSGKIFYDLLKQRSEMGVKDVVILRVEQLYPYPQRRIQHLLEKYQSANEICWVQEEPKNMGAWSFIAPRLFEELKQPRQVLRYIGRAAAASPATGFLKKHEAEQQAICLEAMM